MPIFQNIAETARPGQSVVGWRLSAEGRTELLQRFSPTYSRIVADHVTLSAKVACDTPTPPDTKATVVGYVDDGEGVEALVVAIDGTTARPDGSIFHITWSLGAGRHARESNDVLADKGWSQLADPQAIQLRGARFP